MKAQKKLNIVLIILVIVLISMVSFIGVFYQSKSQMLNKIPGYTLGTDLTGHRRVVLTVSEIAEDNPQELKTYENFIKSANIIKKRLASMKIADYTVRCDETTGQIEITIPEDAKTDYILADITQKGKFEIVDSTNNEVLMNNSDIKNVKVQTTESTYSSYKNVYMDMNFNIKGTRKFKDITKNYQNVVVNEVANNTVENNEVANNISEGQSTENTTTNETSGTSAENTKNEVSLNLDGTSMMTTSFSEIIDNGVFSLSLGTSTSSDDLKIKMYQAESLAAILENDEIPLQYTITGNLYISSSIEQSNINILIYVGIAIAVIIFIYAIVKYKTKGLAVCLSGIGFIALYMLVLRYANVVISLNGIFAVAIIFVINHLFNLMYLNRIKENKENPFKNALGKFVLSIIPLGILSIICCFASQMSIFSFGMVLFWGIIISIIYNAVITQAFISSMKKGE